MTPAAAEPCVCETDAAVPCCSARPPGEPPGWTICTRGVGHAGEHVFCGGEGPQGHGMRRWPAEDVSDLL